MPSVTEENIAEFQDLLLNWFKSNGRVFPWRDERLRSYQLIIAEVLLQRTRAETVAKFYNRFLTDFPDWKSLADANVADIARYLEPIGLYNQRAKRLKSLAVEMVKRYGVIPFDRQELESIPFFGQYLANAVELTVFNQRSPLLDVNMARVLERYFGKRKLADIRYDPYLQDLSYKVVDHPDSKNLNWAILDFAALICKAKTPLCNICFLAFKCNYFNEVSRNSGSEETKDLLS